MGIEEAQKERNEQLEHEIAKRKQAESQRDAALEALRELEGFFGSLLEHAPMSIYVSSTDGRLRLVNRAWEEFEGLRREEVIGRHLEQIFPAEVARQYLELNQRVVDAGTPVVTEEIGDASDGRRYFHTVKFPLRDIDGEIEAVGGVSVDVTERRRAEEALRASEELYRTLIEISPDAITVTDLDANILMCNPRAAALYGFDSAEELIGKSAFEFYAPEDRQRAQENLRNTLEARSIRGIEYTLLKRDGTRFFGESSASLILDTEERPQSFIGITRDITQRKYAEEALRKRNLDLELLNRAARALSSTLDLDQVLATVLDEIRNVFAVAACSVWLVDNEQGEVVCRQASGPGSDVVRGWRLAPGEGIVGWVARHGESLVVTDARADKRHFRGVDQEIGFELRSILSIPLRVKQNVIGAIQVLDTKVGRFTAADLALIEPLAATAAVAIENARLYEEADRLRAFNENIVQNVEGGIIIVDEKGHVTFVNPRGAALMGYTPEELIGRHWTTVMTPQGLARANMESAKLRHGAAAQFETVGLPRQGQLVPFLVSAVPLFEGERYRGVLASFVDITERKRAEEEREQLISDLKEALANIKTLKGLIPICASCKKIRTDEGYWQQVEVYIRDHSEVEFSHGLCPDCLKNLYPDFAQDG